MKTTNFQFIGLWRNTQSNEIIKISSAFNADLYYWHTDFENDEFQKQEKVAIYITNQHHALLGTQYLRKNLFLFGYDTFKYEGIDYKRISS